ncbi:glutamate dehydrogenase 1, mitochondrial [Platysternon megacephalum]|uniref:Glutamate dehydrogenase 1, mitochondrial n=1 Tax=Platysternon megacephalum TaxID=55544 RepID=A0A4D9EG29_9SAUR|nr:glutamate dehydrogenase 1, mitochondrial [Platysternon megacephalum]
MSHTAQQWLFLGSPTSRCFDGWWGKGTLNSISSFHPYNLPFEAAASLSSLSVTVQGVGLCTQQQSPDEVSAVWGDLPGMQRLASSQEMLLASSLSAAPPDQVGLEEKQSQAQKAEAACNETHTGPSDGE